MDDHNDFAGMIEEMNFDDAQPTFYFCNLGETHYPYMLSREEAPVLHGVHGVFKKLDNQLTEPPLPEAFFNMEKLAFLQQRQVQAVEYIDSLVPKLLAKLPANSHIIVTADHGELFGEGGYFGHGPIHHKKVFEVPFLEGTKPA
jgi:membrane-anchored protein YejM (alkaline phosphatase superfamily)